MDNYGRNAVEFDSAKRERLIQLAAKCRGDILRMTTLAGCGHPGGSMSSVDLYLSLFTSAQVDPTEPFKPERDRILISHGHTSPGAYAVLGNLGFFPIDDAIAHFRQAGSPYEGHVEANLPGIEWSSGNLGQGLSAGCGMALNSRLREIHNQVYVVMGDGEQQKGQISEARRFAVKFGLYNLTCLVDLNGLQISGSITDVMPQNIRSNFESDGWKVLEIDGHDFDAIHGALDQAVTDTDHCVAILAHTVMGKGVSFMENVAKWHGQALSNEKLPDALAELGQRDNLDQYRQLRTRDVDQIQLPVRPVMRPVIDSGEPMAYGNDKLTDNRSAWGNALTDITGINMSNSQATPIAVFDCDLASSVKTNGFEELLPDHFFQCGVMEHHTAVAAGALSTQDVQVFWADFGIFGVDEVYNQIRINDINETNLKLVCTHLGSDVGEDGKTHHCIDYLGLLNNLFHFRTLIPADPNQTDRIVRWAAGQAGNYFIGMGRSKSRIITTPAGEPFFDRNYEFRYGKADILRDGKDISIITMGILAPRAVAVADDLSREGISVGVYNFSCAKDLDLEVLATACRTGTLITYEDHHVGTGLGTIVADRICRDGHSVRLIKKGIAHYASSGKPDHLLSVMGLDEESLKQTIRDALAG